MADNTERPATAGGDTIADEALLNDDGTTSAKVQALKLMLGGAGKNAGGPSPLTPLPGRSDTELWSAIRREMTTMRRLLGARLPDVRVNTGSMLPVVRGGPVPIPPTPGLVLGSRLSLFYGGGASSFSGGTWSPTVGSSTWTQATAGSRPTADTSTLAGGNLFLAFNGTSQELGTSGNNQTDHLIELTNWPALANFQRMMFWIFQTSSSALQAAIRFNGTNTAVDAATHKITPSASGAGTPAVSNSAVNDGAIHTLIMVGDDTSKVGTLYIDGVAQTTTGNYSAAEFGAPGEWGASNPDFGSVGGAQFWAGKLGQLGFAITAAGQTFSGTDITNLHAALKLIITG